MYSFYIIYIQIYIFSLTLLLLNYFFEHTFLLEPFEPQIVTIVSWRKGQGRLFTYLDLSC